MEKFISKDTNTVRFTFEDGVPDYTFDVAKVADALKPHALLMAFNHRLGDAAAIAKTKDNGFRVTEAMRREAVVKLGDYYMSGAVEWNMRSIGAKAPAINPTWAAIAAKKGISYEAYMAERVAADLAELAALG